MEGDLRADEEDPGDGRGREQPHRARAERALDAAPVDGGGDLQHAVHRSHQHDQRRQDGDERAMEQHVDGEAHERRALRCARSSLISPDRPSARISAPITTSPTPAARPRAITAIPAATTTVGRLVSGRGRGSSARPPGTRTIAPSGASASAAPASSAQTYWAGEKRASTSARTASIAPHPASTTLGRIIGPPPPRRPLHARAGRAGERTTRSPAAALGSPSAAGARSSPTRGSGPPTDRHPPASGA